jgi:hypothetical protein
MSILKISLMVVGGVLVLAALAHVVSVARFRAHAAGLAQEVAAGPPVAQADLPGAIRDFAERNGAAPGSDARAARLTQDAEYRRGPDAEWGPMPAVQHMGLGRAAFVWNARAPGPLLPSFTVIDGYVGGTGMLRAMLLGSIPVAKASGPIIDRAEAMRYLAEMPWAPDAILGNPEVTWADLGEGRYEAALDTPSGRVAVTFTLDAAGDIAEMTALRPDAGPDGAEILREWRGRYWGYDRVGGRRIPVEAEVGYVDDGFYWGYWRGRITSVEILR